MAVEGNIRLWPLAEAADHISQRAGRTIQPAELIALGAECRLDVFWRNSKQEFSALVGFGDKVEPRERALRHLRVTSLDLGRLEVDDRITTSAFEPTVEDQQHLKAVGSADGMRVTTNPVAVHRDQLFVRPSDLDHTAESYRDPETPMVATPKAASKTGRRAWRSLQQDDEILAEIERLGLNPMALKRGNGGTPGDKLRIKNGVINSDVFRESVAAFDKTWVRLKNAGRIADAPG